jgi:hypothetical protein
MQPINLFVSPALVKSSQEANNPLLKIPPHAVTGRKNSSRWNERLRVEEATVEQVLNDKGDPSDRTALRLRFRVSAASADNTNMGRTARASYLINLKAADGTGDRMMTDISLGRVNALLRAAGYTIPDEGFNLADYFCAASPLINVEVNAVIIDHPDRNDPNMRRQDIGNFTMVED